MVKKQKSLSGSNDRLRKKKSGTVGEEKFYFETPLTQEDKYHLADLAFERLKDSPTAFSKQSFLKAINVSKSGYYAWKNTADKRNEDKLKADKEDEEIMAMMLAVTRRYCYVPGARQFRNALWRMFSVTIGRKRIRRLMHKMNICCTVRKKDAYKGNLEYFHFCNSIQNFIKQEFGDRPRTIVLTDITYLYFGKDRELCYLCAFKDAYTREILGWAIKKKMDLSLVKEAYDRMMEKHGSEFTEPQVFIHSDQGSQYMSTTFQQILKDDGFIQSMSRRANSQDNAPMESFWATLKAAHLTTIARCKDYESVVKFVDAYIDFYNNDRYAYDLAGLTPVEFYKYRTTGIYPFDNYYGIKASEFLSVEELVEAKLELQKKKKDEKKKKYEEPKVHPADIIAKDQNHLKRKINQLERLKKETDEELRRLKGLLDKIKEAAKAYGSADDHLKEQLSDPQNWKNIPPFNYVTEIGPLY